MVSGGGETPGSSLNLVHSTNVLVWQGPLNQASTREKVGFKCQSDQNQCVSYTTKNLTTTRSDKVNTTEFETWEFGEVTC